MNILMSGFRIILQSVFAVEVAALSSISPTRVDLRASKNMLHAVNAA